MTQKTLKQKFEDAGIVPKVHLSGPNNSTTFTDCCNVAITAWEDTCPHCGCEIWPGPSHNNRARFDYAFSLTREGRELRKLRAEGRDYLDDEDRYRRSRSG